MNKESKLSEKGTRTPDARQGHWEEIVARYIAEMGKLVGESARSHRFSVLLSDLLGCQPALLEDYFPGIEKDLRVRHKDRILRGRADTLFGNVIIEFESQIPRNLAQAESQLKRYVAIVWSNERPEERRPYLCIATDGVRFRTYSPSLADPKAPEVSADDVHLELLEESDWTKLEPREVFYWLDRHFVRQEILHPTTEAVVHDFGVRSHAFQTVSAALSALWRGVKRDGPFEVIYFNWEAYLRTVYGSDVTGDELFVRHTYLATLAKLMSWMRISEGTGLPGDAQIVEILEGRWFKEREILNFIEEDFFSWLIRPSAVKIGVASSRWLLSLLQKYNLRELSEDVLKSLYQELVDPKARHDLGEYYTPDWLAHRIVRRVLHDNTRARLLDPACGSGTFLYLAIREKRAGLPATAATLRHILDSVYGVDVHPLAVIVAKTNYILALGDLLKKRRVPIGIPIYLADSLKLPQLEQQQTIVLVNGTPVPALPEPLLKDVFLYDRAIGLASEFALQRRGTAIGAEEFRRFLVGQDFPRAADPALVQGLFAIAQTFKQFIDTGRDTIYAYILKNIYKPLFLKKSFDLVVGNPPWIAFRYLEPEYQRFLKLQITGPYGLLRKRVELITHLEVGTFFLLRAADLYLKAGGTLAFVLPKSVFTADQHDSFRRRSFRLRESPGERLFWKELWDCESVKPLFGVPACVVVGEKRKAAGGGEAPEPAIPGHVMTGILQRKNASMADADNALGVQDVEFCLQTRANRSFWAAAASPAGRGPSPYRAEFSQGATIVPRSFWFVRVPLSPVGFNPKLPLLETDNRAREEAKAPYKEVSLSGNVETPFLYATLLSTDLLPFGHLHYRLVVLPVEPTGQRYEVINAEEARRRGFLYLARWLDKVQAEWERQRGSKAPRATALAWLDYRRKLTLQNPATEYRVLYNTSGTFLTAAVLERERISFAIGGQRVLARGFVADTKTYFTELSEAREAFFLASTLNAPVVDLLLKPMQSRGLWGPRDIHKKVLELPIPHFDPKNAAHRRLAKLAEECTEKVSQWLEGGGPGSIKSIGRLRAMVRGMLKDELSQIDELVKSMLGVA